MTSTPHPASAVTQGFGKPSGRRVVVVNGWRITQIRQRDGSWWNFGLERLRG